MFALIVAQVCAFAAGVAIGAAINRAAIDRDNELPDTCPTCGVGRVDACPSCGGIRP